MLLFKMIHLYYTWKNIRPQCQKIKLKTIASTQNDEFELPDGSYSESESQVTSNTL